MSIPAINSASSGIQRAVQTMDAAQTRIASSGVADTNALIRSTVDMKSASLAVKANVAVLKVVDEMNEHLIDILA